MVRWGIVCVFGIGAMLIYVSAAPHARKAYVAAIDVGQGDSMVVGGELNVMIDTGNYGSRALEKAKGVAAKIDALIITHLHEDHAGDAITIIRSRPSAVFWNGEQSGTLYEKIQRETQKQEIPLVAVAAGDIIHAGISVLEIMGPPASFLKSTDLNDSSLIIKATVGNMTALLMGDATKEVEERLDVHQVDILKVGHHGSKNSSSKSFIDKVRPDIALISSGKGNKYGHPAKEALERLASVRVLRTDIEGSIVISKQGGAWQISTSSVQ